MDRDQVFEQVKSIVSVFCKNKANLETISPSSRFIQDLDVNSARLVDIILDIEDAFDIQIDDESADKIITMNDAVNLILEKQAEKV